MKYIDEQTLGNQEPHDEELMVFTYAANDTNDVHTQIHAYIEELLLGSGRVNRKIKTLYD